MYFKLQLVQNIYIYIIIFNVKIKQDIRNAWLLIYNSLTMEVIHFSNCTEAFNKVIKD